MKSYLKNSINIFLLVLLVSNFRSIAQEVQPDAIYLDQVKEYTLSPDGSWNYHYSHKLKLLTYYAFHTLYGEDFILYNPDYQKLEIKRSITTMADGTLVPAPDNAFNELLPGFAANAPAFNKLREMAVTHTGLERGAVMDFDYILSTAKGFTNALTGNEILWMNSPVDKLTFIIHVPSGVSLNYSQFNISEKPVVTRNGNQATYTWTLKNLPAATREDFRSKELQNRPRIVFSSAKNSNKLLESFLKQPAFELKSDESIRKVINEVRSQQKNDLAVMMRLQDIVANEVNLQAIPLPLIGYKVRSCNEIFESNGGSELEKAILLASMIDAAGIKAIPVAIAPEKYFDKKSFNLQLAERFLVKATDARGETYYLSPLQNDLQDQQFQLSGKVILPLAPAKSLQADKEKTAPVEFESVGKLQLNKQMELSGNISLSISGRLNPYLKLGQDSSYSSKILKGMIESAKINHTIFNRLDKDKCSLEYEVASKDFVKELSGHYFLKIPAYSSGIEGWHMNELVSTRVEPLELPFPVNESYHFTITLPEGYELITDEYSLSMKKEFGNLGIHISQEGRTLEIERTVNLSKSIIEPSEYAEFKSFINTWNNKKYREVILRIGPK